MFKRLAAALCGVLALFQVSPALGQERGAERAIEEEIMAEELLFGAEPVVTSAARREQPLHEAPFAVTVFENDDLKLFGIHSLGDVLRLVPGMDVSYITPGFTYFNIRGFATEKNVRTLVLLDGRIVNIEAVGPSDIEILPVSVEEIERIEVIRGGGSALYGANAYSGVISIITRHPEKTPIGWASLSGGAQPEEISSKPLGTSSASAGSGYWKKGFWGYRVSAGYRQSNDWVNPDDINHKVKWGRLLVGTDAIPGARLSLEGGGEIVDSTIFASLANVPYEGLDYYSQLKGEWKGLSFNTYYRLVHVEAFLSTKLFYNLINFALPITGDTSSVTTDIQYSFPLGEWGHLIPGVNFRYMSYDISNFRKELNGQDLTQELMVGGFAHFEARPAPPLSLVLDARYDWFSITKPAFSPRLAILYSLFEGHILRAAAGQSFRKPVWLEAQGISEQDLLKRIFTLPLGNPDVGNELVRTAELGYRGYLLKQLRTELNLFYDQYTDFILLQIYLSENGKRSENKFRAENLKSTFWGTGGEAEIGYEPFPWLATNANYSLLYRKDIVVGVTKPYTQNKAALSLKLMPPGLPFFGLTGNYVGSFHYEIVNPSPVKTEAQKIPYYVLINAVVGYSFLKGNLETGLHIFNLLNQHHRESSFLEAPQLIGAEEISQKLALFIRWKF